MTAMLCETTTREGYAMNRDTYDPIQTIFIWYRHNRDVYYEPLRALALPRKDAATIRNRPGCVRCKEQFFPRVDSEECKIVEALDKSADLGELFYQIRAVLMTLRPREKKLIEMLSAYTTSAQQFDFATIALTLTKRDLGLCAPPYPDEFRAAKHRRRVKLVEEWQSIRENVATILDGFPLIVVHFSIDR